MRIIARDKIPSWLHFLDTELYRKFMVKIRSMQYWRYRKNNPIFEELIKDKRVLIIGSGPSAADLGDIPDDVLIFACNYSPVVFLEKKYKQIDLYATYAIYFEENKNVKKKDVRDLLSKVRINYFVFDDKGFLKKKNLEHSYQKLIIDECRDNHYLNELIKPCKVKDLKGTQKTWIASTGLRLLQYALYFKAKEIYLIGIDINDAGHYYEKGSVPRGGSNELDMNFFKLMAEKHNNIYAVSKNSPIVKFVPHKELV